MDKESPETAQTRQTIILLLLSVLGLLVMAVGADSALRSRVFVPPRDRQLEKAAGALTAVDQKQRRRTQDIQMPGGTMAAVELGPQYDPREALTVWLELEQARRQHNSLIARLRGRSWLSTGDEGLQHQHERARGKREDAAKHLGEFLMLEPARARLLLCALGWSECRSESEVPPPEKLPPPYPAVPPILSDIPASRREIILRDASDPQEPWLSTARRLEKRHGLDPDQIGALQCWQMRRTAGKAFRSGRDRNRAATTLQRHAALVPSQVNAVFGMLGARKLLEAGPASFPQLLDLLEVRPDMATALLREAAGQWGLYRQAYVAAGSLAGPNGAAAQKELLALGPFALDVLRELERTGRAVSEAQKVRRRLRNQWPGDESALEVLGNDPRLWRRWYEHAQNVL